mgnify:CR=1 FL=1
MTATSSPYLSSYLLPIRCTTPRTPAQAIRAPLVLATALSAVLILLWLARATPASAATVTVNSTDDPAPVVGSCPTTCTLRNALSFAQSGDTIAFDVTGAINLSNTLIVTRDVTIQGPGAALLAIDGQHAVEVLFVDTGVRATIAGLTVRNGIGIAPNGGGGGIYNNRGFLTIASSVISGNTGEQGGGILSLLGTLTVIDSTISGNSATSTGAGIAELNGTLLLRRTTLSNNVGPGILGGGLYTASSVVVIENSTLSGNAAGRGGAINNHLSNVTIVSSTLSNNTASLDSGGAIENDATAFLKLRGTIVVGNGSANACTGPDITSLGASLSDTAACFPSSADQGDIVTSAPVLGPLADNGGPTWTHALLPGSPAIDAGPPGGCVDANNQPLTTDQRGISRSLDGNNDGSARCDIGAVEARVPLLRTTSGPLTFTEGDGPTPIDPGLTLSAAGIQSLTGAIVELTSGYEVGKDQLAFTSQNGIVPSISINGGSLTLTLSGPATVAQYQAALRSVTYQNVAHPPSTAQRTASFSVQSPLLDRFTASRQIGVVNLPPSAVADTYAGAANTPLTVSAPGLLANDTDVAGTQLTAVTVSQPQHGTLSLNPNGGFTYTPANGFVGADTFTYRASDGNAQSSPATVTVNVAPTACVPRPKVQVTSVTGGGKLSVHVEATPLNTPGANRLSRIEFGAFQNAKVTLNGQAIVSGQTFTPQPGTISVDFTVERITPGQPTTVPFTLVDGCGSWKSFVGGGTGAAF